MGIVTFKIAFGSVIIIHMSIQNDDLADSLVKDGYLKTFELIEVFKNIDRIDFITEDFKTEAYENIALPIGFGQTISQPLTVAFMLELLQPRAGEKILEIGSGSGWQTAILAQIVSRAQTNADQAQTDAEKFNLQGKIVAIEIIPELREMTGENVSKYNFIEKKVVESILGDGSKGYKKEAPFDRIIAGASAQKDVPIAWKRQLKIGGRIVAPVGQSIVVIDKISKNKYNQKEYFGFAFVPLIEK